MTEKTVITSDKTVSVYDKREFDEAYTYDGNDLGAVWSPEATVFKVWAPTAENVLVNLYRSGEPSADDLIRSENMKREAKGVWSLGLEGDLNGVYYTYTAVFGGEKNEACDPYARAVGVNGARAMVINLKATDPEGWDEDSDPNRGKKPVDAVIYELHIRDFSSDASSGIADSGRFLGLTERGTVNRAGVPTGLDHIIDMGITHLQLSPVYDFATVDEARPDIPQYNWGYDPLNYNVPEGSYSSDPANGAVRIRELKEAVSALHRNGISVVMDVVYNHTYNTDYCFNRLVPGYFHRPGSNGSECGNDVASERPMVRKFIVDSVLYWAKEYHIDGFRFDLAGLIDTETIGEIRAELDKTEPSMLLYGEGWKMPTAVCRSGVSLSTQENVGKLGNFAMFSDTVRDAVKGGIFEPKEPGYISGNFKQKSTVADCVTGCTPWSRLPFQQIVYVSCHDNRTLWDEIGASNPEDSFEDRLRRNLLGAAIVFTSQGIPFIFAGEEFLRSKVNSDGSINDNSYNAPDSVNGIRWDSLSSPGYRMARDYYKGLIAFRKAHASLRCMEEAAKHYSFVENTPEGVIAYELEPCNGEISDSIFAVYNPSRQEAVIELPPGRWSICVCGGRAGCESLGEAEGRISVEGLSAAVLVKGRLK